jgi:RNA-directed DNA polymerase
VRDRVVQTALKIAIEPIFEKEFLKRSYGFRPRCSARQALRRVWLDLKAGECQVVDADLKRFFDTIPHGLMLKGVEARIADGKIISLVKVFLAQGVMGEEIDPENEGTPQGSVISPLLANIALHGLDQMAEEAGMELVRFADDFVVLSRTRDEAESNLEAVKDWTERNGLKLHPDKTRIVDYESGESFEFLGYEFKKGMTFPRRKSIKKLKGKIRDLTPRTSGRSLAAIVSDLNPILRGWYNYFRHSYKTAFPPVDQFVRQRLRGILCKRSGRVRVPKGADLQRWPNAYFHSIGLFSAEHAHAARPILSEATH